MKTKSNQADKKNRIQTQKYCILNGKKTVKPNCGFYEKLNWT